MIEFNIGGRRIDVPQGLKIDFKKKNILFSFDDIEVERTTSFRLPKTPTNLSVFGFSNDYHRLGDAMRIRIDAQMTDGLVAKKGYLYVSSYDMKSDEFECIFVTGELLGLQQLREMGDISQFISSTIYGNNNSSVYWANAGSGLNFARIKYMTDGDVKLSSNLQSVIDAVIAGLPIQVDMSNVLNDFSYYRLITPKSKGIPQLPITISRTFRSLPVIGSEEPVQLNYIDFENTEVTSDLLRKVSLTSKPVVQSQNGVFYSGYVQCFKALQDLNLEFPADLWENVFLATPNDSGGFDFLGDYSFTKIGGNLVITGDPLAGRSVSIPLNSTFIFITPYDYIYETNSSNVLIDGWQIDANPLVVTCTISGSDNQPIGANVRMKDNLPEMNVVDFFKMIAALSGTILNYKNRVVKFESYPQTTRLQIDDAVEVGIVKRTFVDYAQNNVVKFGDDIVLNYPINNVNIEFENVLTSVDLYLGDNGYVSNDIDKYSILSGKEDNLNTISFQHNAYLKSIISKSTTIELRCAMNAYIFDLISQNTIILFDNIEWVWVDANWSKGISKFTLAKL